MAALSVVGLFAGIGGFERAFSQAGFATSMLVEIDPAAKAVLETHFRGVPVVDDVETLQAIPLGTNIVTAGFPCQNLSMAGDKSGIGGPKSSIVRSMFRLIESADVPTVVVENVPFMLRLDSGQAMAWLVDQFEQLDYQWAYRVLDAIGFGLPQRRRRVYLVASKEVDPRRVLFANDATVPPSPEPDISRYPLGFYWTEGRSGVGFTVDGIPPLKVGSGLGIPSAPCVLFTDGEVLMPGQSACEALQGFPRGWTDAATAVEPRSRWRLVGNSVSVPVARWVAERIRNPGNVLDFEEVSLRPGTSWPNAAWSTPSGAIGVLAGTTPVVTPRQSISDLREESWLRLSERALAGFIKRASEGNLKMPEGFLDAVRRAPRKSP